MYEALFYVVEIFLTSSPSSGMSHCPVFFGTWSRVLTHGRAIPAYLISWDLSDALAGLCASAVLLNRLPSG